MREAKRRKLGGSHAVKPAKPAKVLHGPRPKIRPSIDRAAEHWEPPGSRKFQLDGPVPSAVRKDKRQRCLPLVAADVMPGGET